MKILKKTLYSVIVFVFFVATLNQSVALAQENTTPTPESNSTNDEGLNERISDLKEKIASRVSELKLVEKRGIIGIITDSSSNSITLTDINDKTKLVDVDEITKFASPSAGSSFGLSDLKEGTRIRVLGLYNKQSERILARFINTSSDPTPLIGTIKSIDEDEFQLIVISSDKKETKIDIETSTDTSIFEKGASDLEEGGFSDFQIGNRVFITGFTDKTDKNLMIADRAIIFTGVPKNPKIDISLPTPTAGVSATPADKDNE